MMIGMNLFGFACIASELWHVFSCACLAQEIMTPLLLEMDGQKSVKNGAIGIPQGATKADAACLEVTEAGEIIKSFFD